MANIDKKLIDDLKVDSETKGKKIEDLTAGLKRTESYMIGIAIVTAFGFGTLLLTGWAFFSDSLHFKSNTYQSLIDKIDQINAKIDKQNDLIYKDDINSLQTEIVNLKKENPYLK